MTEPVEVPSRPGNGSQHVCGGCGDLFFVGPVLHPDEDLEARGGVPDRCNGCIKRRIFVKRAIGVTVAASISLPVLVVRIMRKWNRAKPKPPARQQ